MNRRGLLHYLLEEIQTGTGLTKLYASLLVRTLLAEQPELRRKHPSLADERDNSRREPSIPRVRSRRAPC
jgi:hypothetical protein